MKTILKKIRFTIAVMGVFLSPTMASAALLGPIRPLPNFNFPSPPSNPTPVSVDFNELQQHGASICLAPVPTEPTEACLDQGQTCGVQYLNCARTNTRTLCETDPNDPTKLLCQEDPRPVCDSLISDEAVQAVRDICNPPPAPAAVEAVPNGTVGVVPAQLEENAPASNEKNLALAAGCSMMPAGHSGSLGSALIFSLSLIPLAFRRKK